MTVGAISSGAVMGGIGSTGLTDSAAPMRTAEQTATQNQDFAGSLAAAAQQSATQPTDTVQLAEPQREISRSATRNNSLGERILDRLEAIHRSDKLNNGDVKKVSSDPLVKVASTEPGPAASALRALPTGADLDNKATRSGSGQFRNMLEQLQQTYGQVIQVSVVSKSSGSFTSSMNRLMSST
jgi:hypothetical protein